MVIIKCFILHHVVLAVLVQVVFPEYHAFSDSSSREADHVEKHMVQAVDVGN